MMSGEMGSGVGRMRQSPPNQEKSSRIVSGRLAKMADPSRATSRSEVGSKSSHSAYPAAAAMSGTTTVACPVAFEKAVSASRWSREHGVAGKSTLKDSGT